MEVRTVVVDELEDRQTPAGAFEELDEVIIKPLDVSFGFHLYVGGWLSIYIRNRGNGELMLRVQGLKLQA